MTTGLKLPLGVNKSGGADVEEDPAEQNRKILTLEILGGDNRNPFQKLEGFDDLIYDIKNPSVQNKARQRLNRIFRKLSDRVALAPDSLIEFDTSQPGELVLSFNYIDLLTNTEQEYLEKFTRGG